LIGRGGREALSLKDRELMILHKKPISGRQNAKGSNHPSLTREEKKDPEGVIERRALVAVVPPEPSAGGNERLSVSHCERRGAH